MNQQIDRLTNLISDLLNVTKIQQGKLELQMQKFDLQELVQEIDEVLQTMSNGHLLTIKGSSKKKVWGDRERIGQVITNLITNAVKYSPHANKVDILLKDEENGVIVTVKDYGIGIDAEHQNKIFNRFYRVNSKDEKTFPGLGIGLYISYQLIKRHGGKMWVDSKKGEGSEFSFLLPYGEKK